MGIAIYYDGECPFCSEYTRLLRLRKAVGAVELIDLRERPDAVRFFIAKGLHPDAGMIVDTGDRYLSGDQAIHYLARWSEAQGCFSWLNQLFFSSAGRSRVSYPLMRAGRNAVLFLMGRSQLTSEPPSGRYTVFAFLWGCFLLLHLSVYATQFRAPLFLSTWLIAPLAAALVLRPSDRRAFVLLIPILLIDAVLQMPVLSNHTIIKNFFVLSMAFAGLWAWFAARDWARFSDAFMGVGRMLLITMYFFGVFHKINHGFLDPEVSCAVSLWRDMPWPLNAIHGEWFWHLAIYGVLVLETMIMAMLLYRPWRHAGIVCGIAFHMMLGLSGYALYPPFSMLSVVLHSCFLSESSASAIIRSSSRERFIGWLRKPPILIALVSMVGVYLWSSVLGNYAEAGIVWFALMVPLWLLFFLHGRDWNEDGPALKETVIASPVWMNILTLLFIFNCITPYLGLKTGQSINMFANLRLENENSNHIILSGAPGPFNYLEDPVRIEDSQGNLYLNYIEQEGIHLTWYHLLDILERDESASVTFFLKGERYEKQSAETLKQHIEKTLHSQWFRKWFHFAPVALTEPKPCAIDR